MDELIKIMVTSIVDKPEEVQVTEVETEFQKTIELRVASEDMGKVIGKQGKIAKAMRSLLKAMATKQNEKKKVILEII